MSPTWWKWARVLGAAAILAVLVRRLGAAPFLDALGRLTGWSLAAATGIAVVTTVCCAWRWRLVARGLGVDVPLPIAVAAYYRSQLLNSTLPGGVLGDVHRAVHHGRRTGDVGRSVRAVAWERVAGQVVQAVLTVAVLVAFPSPVRSSMPIVVAAVAAAAVGVLLVSQVLSGGARSGSARIRRSALTDIRDGLLARRAWPGVVVASAVVVAGHTATFLIAARTAGVTASTATLLPLALLVLLATSVPIAVAGWGPREGIAAWSFGVAGLGTARGVTTAVVYGVMAIVACLPGAAVLLADGLRRSSSALPRLRVPVRAASDGVAHG